jgi:fatty-acyl-CoA synthase
MPRGSVAERPTSCGVPVPYTHVRVVSPEGGEAVTDEVGEVWLKGPSITPGYWRVAAGDSDSFDDGWFRTGDAARVDEAGFYYLVDRYKDMYKSGAENVYPAEVERVLATHPAVAEVAIIGVPDERWGQVGRAFVVTQSGASVSLAELVAHGERQIARYKLPKHLTLLDALPRNTTGKVQKQQLKAEHGIAGL